MLLGSGRNGKSTPLHLLTALLGEDNVWNVKLQEFMENRFSKAELFGKVVEKRRTREAEGSVISRSPDGSMAMS